MSILLPAPRVQILLPPLVKRENARPILSDWLGVPVLAAVVQDPEHARNDRGQAGYEPGHLGW